MSTFQKIVLAILILAMIVMIIVFWGSIVSIIFASGLILIIPAYLLGRFINNDEDSDFTDDKNE